MENRINSTIKRMQETMVDYEKTKNSLRKIAYSYREHQDSLELCFFSFMRDMMIALTDIMETQKETRDMLLKGLYPEDLKLIDETLEEIK